jgi:hypothetical protein
MNREEAWQLANKILRYKAQLAGTLAELDHAERAFTIRLQQPLTDPQQTRAAQAEFSRLRLAHMAGLTEHLNDLDGLRNGHWDTYAALGAMKARHDEQLVRDAAQLDDDQLAA